MREHGFDAAARPGRKGQFDVLCDGRLIFSKDAQRRFPEPGEVLRLLRSA